MSLRMQVEKRKAQEQLRRLMTERKKKKIPQIIIDNPLAKYNNTGQLTCILCSSIVKSENVWQVHLNSKQHRENVEQAKRLKAVTNNFTVPKVKHKRPTTPPNDAPQEKRLKSILKNANETLSIAVPKPVNNSLASYYHNEEIKRAPLNPIILASMSEDSKEELANSANEPDPQAQPISADHPIPEGFFDDPILDAKVRNIEYKDPVEEEWEKFQKEIKEEASASAEIIAGEQEEATAERQIEEIDEQIRNWSRVLDLELKKEETKKKKQEVEQMNEDENEDDVEVDIDEFLDWRAKKSYT